MCLNKVISLSLSLFTRPFVMRNCLLFYATSIHPFVCRAKLPILFYATYIHPSVCRAELPTVLRYVYSPVRLSCRIAYCSTLRLFTRPFVVRNCLLFLAMSIHPSVCRAELPTVLRYVYSPVRLSCGIAYCSTLRLFTRPFVVQNCLQCSTLRLFTRPFVVRNCLLFYATSIHPSVCRAELPTVLRYVYSPVRLSCRIAYCVLRYVYSPVRLSCRIAYSVLRCVYSPVRLSCRIAYCSTLRLFTRRSRPFLV